MKTSSKIPTLLVAAALCLGAAAIAEDAKAPTKDEKAQQAQKPQPLPQTKCPVMGGDINKNLYVDVDGKRIYVCCGGCISAIKKDPQKYIKELEAKGIALDKPK